MRLWEKTPRKNDERFSFFQLSIRRREEKRREKRGKSKIEAGYWENLQREVKLSYRSLTAAPGEISEENERAMRGENLRKNSTLALFPALVAPLQGL